ncbi:hypothetical protein ACA910_006074 [Epithemia clementina (nom. ined.)]
MNFYDNSSSVTTSNNNDNNDNQNAQQVAEEEETISAYFVFFSALLALVLIFSRILHDHPRIASIVPEAGMILITGVVFGAIIDVFFTSSTTITSSTLMTDDDYNHNNNSNNANTDDLAAGQDYDKNNNMGASGEEEEEMVVHSLLNFSPAVFFLVLLPPIIFNSGYHLRKELFFRHLTPICLLAVVGTIVSNLVTAILLQVICQHLLPADDDFIPTFTELLTFGALLSATDPVSTLAVFQAKRVDPQLFYLVFGESVLNDAVSLVLFNAFKDFVKKDNGAGKVAVGMSEFILGFLYDSIGSPLLGLLCGLATAWMFKRIDFRPTRVLELSLFILIMYVPFLLAELLDLSGIVTILFSGLAAKAYVVPNLSAITVQHADILIRLASHLAETAIFLELGLSVFGLKGSIHVAFICWTIVVCLIARAAHVYPITYLYNRSLEHQRRRQGGGIDLVILPPPPALPKQQSQQYNDSSDASPSRNGAAPHRPSTLELTNLPSSQQETETDNDNDNDSPQGDQRPLSPKEKKESLAPQAAATPNPVAVTRQLPQHSENDVNEDLKIPPNTAHMVWFSGLRGAVAYACVRSFPNTFGHADEFTMTTMIVVLVSVFGLGSTTECMLNLLHIPMNVDEDSIREQWQQQPGGNVGRIRLWEDFLYRHVVRGADRINSFSHVVIDTEEEEEEGNFHNSKGNHQGNDASISPIRPRDVERSTSEELQLTPSADFQQNHATKSHSGSGDEKRHKRTPSSGNKPGKIATKLFQDVDEEDDEDGKPVYGGSDDDDVEGDTSRAGITRGSRKPLPLSQRKKESVFDYGAS